MLRAGWGGGGGGGGARPRSVGGGLGGREVARTELEDVPRKHACSVTVTEPELLPGAETWTLESSGGKRGTWGRG